MALHWMPARERRRGECEPRRDRELEDANNLFPRRNMSFFTEAWEMHAYACQTIDHRERRAVTHAVHHQILSERHLGCGMHPITTGTAHSCAHSHEQHPRR